MKNYFAKVSKTGILEALTEAKGDIAPAWNKAKKGDLAVIAERQLAETGWLPHCCARPPDALSPDGPCSCAPPFRRPGLYSTLARECVHCFSVVPRRAVR